MEPRIDPRTTEAAAVARFLRDVERAAALPPSVSAADATTAVTCALTMRVSGGEARDVLESLPVSVHALLRRCDRHPSAPAVPVDREAFVRRIAEHLGVSEGEAEGIAFGVFSALRARLPMKEAEDVASQLPKELREQWRRAAPGLAEPEERVPAGITPQVAHFVLGQIEQSGALPAVITGAQAFTAVMCTLEHALSAAEAQRFARTLPGSIRPLVDRCAVHRNGPTARLHSDEFTLQVADHLHTDAAPAEAITRAVFAAVQRLLSAPEVEEVARELAPDLRDMWRFPRLNA